MHSPPNPITLRLMHVKGGTEEYNKLTARLAILSPQA